MNARGARATSTRTTTQPAIGRPPAAPLRATTGVRVGIPLILAVVTLLLYLPTLSYDFVNYDDPQYVTECQHVRDGLTIDGVRWAFTTLNLGNWHPLAWLSYMGVSELLGAGPGAHHGLNAALHVANTVLLYVVLFMLTAAPWRSAVVAALFGWHPTRVESVAWIAERKDLLCALFVFLAIWAYARYAAKPNWKRYALVVVAFAMALMSKSMGVTLPALLLVLDYWPLGRLSRGSERDGVWRRVPEKLPLFAMSAAVGALAIFSQASVKAVASGDMIPLSARLSNAAVSCIRYLRMAAVPTNLAVFYPRQAWSAWQALFACGLLIGITAAVFYSRKRYAIVGWLWFLIALSPVIGVLQVGDQALADRYTYLPLIGIFVAVVWAVADVAERVRAARRAIVYLTAGSLTVYALATAIQVTYWRDSVSLFTHAIDVTRGNYLAHYNLGVALAQRQQFAEAADHYALALRFKPTYLDAHVNLGAALQMLGNRAGAEAQYRAALELDPNDADAKANLDALLAGGSSGSKGGSTMPTTAPSPPSP